MLKILEYKLPVQAVDSIGFGPIYSPLIVLYNEIKNNFVIEIWI